ncbi:hypothetical protein [Kribbella sp. NPDC055071]
MFLGLTPRPHLLGLVVEQIVEPMTVAERLDILRLLGRIGARGNGIDRGRIRLLLRLRRLLLALQPLRLGPLPPPALHPTHDQLDRVHQRDHRKDRYDAVQRVLLRPVDHPVGDPGNVVQEVRGPVRDPQPAVDQRAEGKERTECGRAGEVRHDGPEDQRADAEGKRHLLRIQLDTARRREYAEHGRTGQCDDHSEQEPKNFRHTPKVATFSRHTPQTLRRKHGRATACLR